MHPARRILHRATGFYLRQTRSGHLIPTEVCHHPRRSRRYPCAKQGQFAQQVLRRLCWYPHDGSELLRKELLFQYPTLFQPAFVPNPAGAEI